MKDIQKKSKQDDDSDFYNEIEEEGRVDYTTSCITLVLFCMILYAGLILGFWKISPWFWQLTNRATSIRNNIKIPSSDNVLNDVKDRVKDTIDSTKESIKNEAKNKIKEETNSVIDSTKDQTENAIQQQNNQIQQELNDIQNE